MLSNNDFKKIISLTPLVAIDILIKYNNKILLGKRINDPAKGYYFIPGGRILKNESLEKACIRLTNKELGFEIPFNKFNFYMNTEHFYDNNFYNSEYSTHYICLCYKYELTKEEFTKININDQHEEIKWLTIDEILVNKNIHENTKKYFINKYL